MADIYGTLHILHLLQSTPPPLTSSSDQVVRERIAITDAAVKRILTQIQALPTLRFASQDEIDQAKQRLESALLNYETHLYKAQRQIEISESESAHYASQCEEIKITYTHSIETTTLLDADLTRARARRAELEQYDRLARKMHSTDHLLPRSELLLTLDRLTTEISELEAIKTKYAETWTARRAQFDEIMNALTGMRRQIQDEKEEQDRREGMADEEGEEEGAIAEVESTPVAAPTESTPVATPVPPTAESVEAEGKNEPAAEATAETDQEKMDIS
ncbi:hypothetical protein BZA70DRAFT_900 [Myxozyma melibiosi]|uniref:THO complex subunit 7 n=1 Tax=Myxozyma melibiosi TaxID=54550 RepID=A0ABR1FAX7_9ASCO